MRIVLCLFLLVSIPCIAQKQNNIWYFGYNAGLDFNTNPPTVLNNSALNTAEGSSSIADPVTGQLLFYTDGIRVWDNTNNQMPACWNTPLQGNFSSTQSAIIVPQPGHPNIYYIFTTPAEAYSYGAPEMRYSIVDMSLNGGLGDLSSMNNSLIDTSTEKVAVIGNCDLSAYWIVGHKWRSDSFYAYHLTTSGLSAPLKSKAGAVHMNTIAPVPGFESIGEMKFSSDGKHIGLVCNEPLNIIEMYSFDEVTGKVTWQFTENSSNFYGGYGCAFSPDNSKFYIANFSSASEIYQYDMNAGSDAAIKASRTLIASTTKTLGAMQNGPDGKLYIAVWSSFMLDVITNPNANAAAVNYVPNAQTLGVHQSSIGLPNLIYTNIQASGIPLFTLPDTNAICQGDSVRVDQVVKNNFSITPGTFITNSDSSTVWFFPDTTTTYQIINVGTCGQRDTQYVTIQVSPWPHADFSFNPASPTLYNATITLLNQSTNASSFAWKSGQQILSTNTDCIINNPGIGQHCFQLIAYNNLGCADSITRCFDQTDTLTSTVFVPSGFSPNGDNLNDIVKVIGTNITLIYFSIYNRFGERIFSTFDIRQGWNGQWRGKRCDVGTYYYMLKYTDIAGRSHLLKGDISLVR